MLEMLNDCLWLTATILHDVWNVYFQHQRKLHWTVLL